MTRSVTIWRTYDDYDMVTSDTYHPTRRAALAHLRAIYGVTEVNADGVGVKADGVEVHLDKEIVVLTKDGICSALKYIPHR